MWGENVQLNRTGAEYTGQEDGRVRRGEGFRRLDILCAWELEFVPGNWSFSPQNVGVLRMLFEQIIQTFSHLPFRTFMLQDLRGMNWVDHSEAVAGMQEN